MSNGINNIIKFSIVAACLMSSYMTVRRFLFYTSAPKIIRAIISGYVDIKRVNGERKEKHPCPKTQMVTDCVWRITISIKGCFLTGVYFVLFINCNNVK